MGDKYDNQNKHIKKKYIRIGWVKSFMLLLTLKVKGQSLQSTGI